MEGGEPLGFPLGGQNTTNCRDKSGRRGPGELLPCSNCQAKFPFHVFGGISLALPPSLLHTPIVRGDVGDIRILLCDWEVLRCAPYSLRTSYR